MNVRELRDPIHGFIHRSETESKIIDAKIFQRLRGVRQLAMANLVYPGALHTRFEHCIGAMHVAGRLAERFNFDDERKRIVRLAALLHDIGHGPFSHVSEYALTKYYDRAKIGDTPTEKIHEKITHQIIKEDSDLSRLISHADREKILRLLDGKGKSLDRQIVSGPLDADKQDYLLRDSYFCGVKYGIYDIERLIGTLVPFTEDHDEFLAASGDGLHTIEQFVLAKYYMQTQVYRHKIRNITDAMIIRALELGYEVDKLEWLIKLYTYDGSDGFIKNFILWDDARVTTALLHPLGKRELATDIFTRLKERKLFKRAFSKRSGDFPASVKSYFVSRGLDRSLKNEIEEKVGDYLSKKMKNHIPRQYVIAKEFPIKSVREQARNTEAYIMIIDDSGQKKNFEEESFLFKSIDAKLNERLFEIYAPLDYADETEKLKSLDELNGGILDIITKAVESRSKAAA